jgi:hypothetical protein
MTKYRSTVGGVAAVLLALTLFAPNASASSKTVGYFTVSVSSAPYSKFGVSGQHVKSIVVAGGAAKAARPQIVCNKKFCGNSVKFKGKTTRTKLYRSKVTFRHVNWVITKGHGLTVQMISRSKSRISEYVDLVPPDNLNSRFTISKVGCLTRKGKKRACPAGAVLPVVNHVLPGAPPPPKTQLAFVSESKFNWAIGSHYIPTAADFNHDGKADFSLHDPNNGYFYFRAAPSFAPATEWAFPWVAGTQFQPYAGDFDGDGSGDIALRDSSVVTSYLRIGPTFGPQIVHDWVIGSHYHAFAGDFDGDGKSDYGVRNAATGGIFWRLGPAYTTERAFSWTPGENYQLVVADFNGDKLADTALRDPGTGVFLIRFGPDFNTSMAYPWTAGPYQPFAADFNGDGLGDLGMRDYSSGDYFIRFAGKVPVG